MPRAVGGAVTFTWEPDPVVLGDAILNVAQALRDRLPAMELARQSVIDDVRARFRSKTDPDWVPWDAWADSYAPVAEAYPNIDMLRRDDILYQSVTSEDAYVVTEDTLFFEAGDMPEYGVWHQEGRPDRKTKSGAANPLPKRAFLGLSDVAEAEIWGDFSLWFDRAIDLYPTSTGRIGRRHSKRGGNPLNMGQFSSL